MPDFSRDDRMPPINQSSLPPVSHTTAPRERRYSGPSDSGGKPARYPAVYQRPPPADYYRGPSPPPQPYRWSPAPPLDEPAYSSRAPHGAYHRDSWDYQYRDSHIVPSRPSFPPSRTPPPFPEWGHMNSERGWSPGFGPEDSRYPRRGDWEDRENSQHYQHGWDHPPSPGPLPPRDWQHGPYDRPPAGQSRGSPSVLHEPGWREPPVSHYDRDLREDWIPPPDDWSRDRDDHFISDDPYLNDPPPPGPSYGPPRARGRSFVQDRRMPQPSSSYNHPPPAQSSPRGPSHMPLDTPNRRHSQHDRRYSGGPGYSSEGRGYIPHGPRRQYPPGRTSFNEPSHLPSRGAKIVPRDQLLVANTSIKVEDTTDGQPLSASTPAPASASSASPDKGSFAGKRSRTDSVAAEAEPASRRPSPFASSAATVATTTADSASAAQPVPTEARPPATVATEKPKQTAMEPPVSVPAELEGKPRVEPQEQRVYADPNGASEPVSTTNEPPAVSAQPDVPLAPANEVPAEETPVALPDDAPKPTDEIPMDIEPSASQNGPVQPLSDVITADSAVDAVPDAPTDTNVPDDKSEASASPEPELETPYEHFEYFDFSEIDDDDNVPPTSARDAIPHRDTDFKKLEADVEAVLQENVDISANHNRGPAKLSGMPFFEIELPSEDDQDTLRAMFAKAFKVREDDIETKVGALEEEYLTLHQEWMSYCAQLDHAAEVRRVKDAKAAAAAALNVVSEPVAAQTRSTRRNPVVNTGVMADAVHSDMEMEKVMNNMRDAAAVDPDLLARPNLAKIPDMVTVTEPEHLRLTFDDENGQVDSPLDFYDFRGRAVEHWTTEERSIFIEQHRIHNKRFEKIAEHLPFKTTSQCVQYYYLMKKVPAFRAQVKRGQRRRLGRGGHQGKASALMADIEKEEDGTTASPREDDSIATRRSRRHATLAAATPPPSAGASEVTKPRRSRVVELARGDSFGTERDGTATPVSVASDSEGGGDPVNPADLGALLSNQSTRKGGPGRGRRWAYKGETPNGNGGSVRLDGAEPPKKRPATTSYWTVAERTALKQHLLHHGRDWNRIASMIQTKTAIQAKNYYFNNQKEMSVFVKAWEREQERGNESEGSPSDVRPEASAATYPSGSAAKDGKKAGPPVTIQPAPGHSSSTSTGGASTPNKANSGRGSSHYPNVIPHSQQPASGSQQPQWAKNTFPVTKTKTQPNQPQVIPTPPLPLPGPTFRAWPVPPVPGPAAAPAVGYSYQTFPGVASPNANKGNGAQPIVQRTGSASASATPSPNANPTSNVGRATSGVQRTSVNHYPGPMRYQPYPIASGAKQAKQMLPQQPGAGYRNARPIPGAVTTGTSPLPKLPLPRNSSGQFASWTGDKGKKPA